MTIDLWIVVVIALVALYAGIWFGLRIAARDRRERQSRTFGPGVPTEIDESELDEHLSRRGWK